CQKARRAFHRYPSRRPAAFRNKVPKRFHKRWHKFRPGMEDGSDFRRQVTSGSNALARPREGSEQEGDKAVEHQGYRCSEDRDQVRKYPLDKKAQCSPAQVRLQNAAAAVARRIDVAFPPPSSSPKPHASAV